MHKIAIDISATKDQNSTRGIGFYLKNLLSAMQTEQKGPHKYDFSIELVESFTTKKFDIIHYPTFDFFDTKIKYPDNQKIITTLHDVIPIEYSDHFPVGLKGKVKWFIQKHKILKSDYIITDSHSAKYSITKVLPSYPDKKIYPIHLAATSAYHPITKTEAKRLTKNLNLPPKFVLFIGDINWNKNLPSLVDICLKNKIPLVIGGKTASQSQVTIPNHPWTTDIRYILALRDKHPDLIFTPGFLPDDATQNAMINLATLYCQPSFAEGFGIPLLEAMQAGCPVVYSKTTSLPEITDWCGLFFNPYDKSDIEKKLLSMWHDPQLQKQSSIEGLERTKLFSWQKTAKQTLALYELCLLST